MKPEPLQSLATSARIFLWIIAAPALATTVLLVAGTWSMVHDLRDDWHSSRQRLAAAAEDLPAGAILTEDNMGVKTFLKAELLPRDWVQEDQARVLLGHRLVTPVSKLAPIAWVDTDIIITSTEDLQQGESTVPSEAATNAAPDGR